VLQFVSRQLVEVDEQPLFRLGHPLVRNAEHCLGGANEAVHVVLVREEDATDGVEEDVVAAVGESTERRYGSTAE